MDLFLESAGSFLLTQKEKRALPRNKLTKDVIAEYAQRFYYVTNGRSGTKSALRLIFDNEKVQSDLKKLFAPVEIMCSVNQDGEVVVNQEMKVDQILGYYTGQLKQVEERNSSLYLIKTRLINEREGKDVFIDGSGYKNIKDRICQDCPANLMCFINHGCPGCSNVDVLIDESINVQHTTERTRYKFVIPQVRAKYMLPKNTVLRYDYGSSYGASTQRQLLLDGFKSVKCNCPMHDIAKFPNWYIPVGDTKYWYPDDETVGELSNLISKSIEVHEEMQKIANRRSGCVFQTNNDAGAPSAGPAARPDSHFALEHALTCNGLDHSRSF